ncbi:hypothetical protein P9112_012632 [Eukaryota sp. TZLM1-RC]
MQRLHSLVLVLLCLSLASAKISSGRVKVKDKGTSGVFKFVDKFAYLPPGEGGLTMDITNNGDPVDLLIYTDDNWLRVYDNNRLACLDKKNQAVRKIPIHKSHKSDEIASYTKYLDRPTFFYIVFARCEPEASIDVDYELEFTNPGNWWKQHLGANLHGLGKFSLAFGITSLILVLLQVYAIFFKWGTSYLHPLIIILTVAIVTYALGVWFFFAFFAKLASSGGETRFLHFVADLFMLSFELCVMLLLILISKGWAVSTTLLSGKTKLITLLSTFVGVELLLLFLETWATDPATHTFGYDNIFGYVSVCLRIVAMFYFLVNLAETRSSESFAEKRKLYDRGGLLFVFWFMIAPVIIFIGSLIPVHDQEKIVDGSLWFFNLLSLLVISWVLWPSRAQKYFKISSPDVFAILCYENEPE